MKYIKTNDTFSTSRSVNFSVSFLANFELCANRYVPKLNDSQRVIQCESTSSDLTYSLNSIFNCSNLIPGRNYSIFFENNATNSTKKLVENIFTSIFNCLYIYIFFFFLND